MPSLQRHVCMKRAIACAVLLASAPAYADDDQGDPAVAQAADANLESTANRRGMTVAVAFGGGQIAGFGIDDSVGRGGSFSLRIGHVATPNTIVGLELAVSGVLHRATETSDAQPNTNTSILIGAQRYINPSLWLRFGLGAAVYDARDVSIKDMPGVYTNRTTWGPSALVGLGLEFWRYRWMVFDVEGAAVVTATAGGVLVATTAGLGISFD